MKNDVLVILAGGYGKRLQGITKGKIPKPIVEFNKKPFLSYLIEQLTKYKFKKIFILAGFKGNLIKKKFHNKKINNTRIFCIIENKPKGTGGALKDLSKKIKKNFILVNGDTFFKINYNFLINYNLDSYYGLMTLTNGYLNSFTKKLNNLAIKNKIIKFSKRSKLINSGIYLLNKKIIDIAKKNKSNKISLENDILQSLIIKNKIIGYKRKGFFIDIGTTKTYQKAKKYFI